VLKSSEKREIRFIRLERETFVIEMKIFFHPFMIFKSFCYFFCLIIIIETRDDEKSGLMFRFRVVENFAGMRFTVLFKITQPSMEKNQETQLPNLFFTALLNYIYKGSETGKSYKIIQY
jgi:hypothetical protein